MDGRYVAYSRVSTQRQGRSGLGLEAQQTAVRDFLNGGNWRLVAEFTEIESGRHDERPELERALQACRRHRATLVVAKLDRLSRSAAFILTTIGTAGVEFRACDVPSANKMVVTILAAVAEDEAERISQRTKLALAAAKRRGVRLGGHPERLTRVARSRGAQASAVTRRARAEQRADDLRPVIEEARQSGALSLRAIAARLNEQGIPAPRGGTWTACAVHRTLARFERAQMVTK